MTKKIYILLIAVLVLAATILLLGQQQNVVQKPSTQQPIEEQGIKNSTGGGADTSGGELQPSPASPQTLDAGIATLPYSQFEIRYRDGKYLPESLTIKQGDEVRFINESGRDMWPASATHPTHEMYPEFDPKQPIPNGQMWPFVFGKTGGWNYHDHLNPSVGGVIVVE